MKILITGASGFIGGRLLDGAIAAWGNDNVIAFSSQEISGCQTIVYNRDASDFGLSAADKALLEGVEVVVHAGAYTPKSGGEANVISACNENIFFTEKLLKLPFNNLQKIVFTSTLDVYAAATPISEQTPTEPATLYGWSKLYCEKVVSAFAAEKKIVSQILRVGHVYGPGEEKYAKFLPKTIGNIVNGASVELYGDGAELRSFIYIDDVIKAILAAVALDESVGVINLVGGHAVSIKEVLDQLILLSGRPVEVIPRAFNGVKRDFVFDTTRLKKYLLPVETDFLSGLRTEFAYFESLK
ncbi:NAD-dependent epimerase/dehydratase family protein [Pseudomonas fontis]|uniref:NAD-dependent epimerase/dehydratase family protein n=1 Tax=Pseudomonas fontis TaxID=2942633 RepID=A0ABT5NNL5_9PSED|nr:NAD-dependent epimerase/dehydratase family protein [Pseudomonas fontis]MDD0973001.1 NAD-dependent epimerase/dehydratase family protein [Pseudomonas fontis]MDD0989770.1 NAD-dependent epimerase/dehydratase family protein [Pseudomonas fontis]